MVKTWNPEVSEKELISLLLGIGGMHNDSNSSKKNKDAKDSKNSKSKNEKSKEKEGESADANKEFKQEFKETGELMNALLAKSATDSDIEIFADFFSEFKVYYKGEVKPDLSRIHRKKDTSNAHDIYARLRYYAHNDVLQRCCRETGKKKVGGKYPFIIYSVAGNANRLLSFVNKVISMNPILDQGDEFRARQNAMRQRAEGEQFITCNCPIRSDGTNCGHVEDALNVERQRKDTEGPTIVRGKVHRIKGDGWCAIYAVQKILELRGRIKEMNVFEFFRWIVELCDKNNDQTMSRMGVLQDLASNQIWTIRQLVMIFSKRDLNHMINLASSDNARKLYQNADWFNDPNEKLIGSIVGRWQGDDFIVDPETNEVPTEFMAFQSEHFDVIQGGAVIRSVNPRLELVGIHNDVHYYPEVMKNICEKSLLFPQYLIGWTFPKDAGIYKFEQVDVEVVGGTVKMSVEGNTSTNTYTTPNFAVKPNNLVFHHSVGGRSYIVRTLRTVTRGGISYRIMKVEPSAFHKAKPALAIIPAQLCISC